MQLVTISFFLWVLSLSIVRGNCNNTLTASLIQNQLRLLEKLINLLDVSKTSKSPVVFHAELGSYKTYHHGSIWVYDKVVTNVGKAYNPSTGTFTAPTDGIYQFNWYTLSDPKTTSHAGLFVNGAMKARQAANNNGGSGQWLTAGSSIALPLNKGDVVYIKDVYGLKAQLRDHWTAFGGVLIN
uniref:C1q domain-containing protein n=1 Tax=Magallana gigas TaxID=29159 RepID=A0A8W8KMK6_MAGGI